MAEYSHLSELVDGKAVPVAVAVGCRRKWPEILYLLPKRLSVAEAGASVCCSADSGSWLVEVADAVAPPAPA